MSLLRRFLSSNHKMKAWSDQRLASFISLCERKGALRQRADILDLPPVKPTERQLLLAFAYGDATVIQASRTADRLHAINPIRIQDDPIALKRAVSWRGLLDLLEVGHVRSMQNRWNSYDTRRLTLYATANCPDQRILSQANELHRQAILAVAVQRGVTPEVVVKNSDLYRSALATWELEEEKSRQRADWTAAVFVTRPVSGSTVWPRHNRENLLPGVEEHGLPDGAIRLTDIKEIRLYREGELILSTDPQGIRMALAGLRSPGEVAAGLDVGVAA